MKQGLCYRSLVSGTCTLPLVQRITKQICCCSRVGKAWGSKCEHCPLPGTGNHTLSPALTIRIHPQSQRLLPQPGSVPSSGNSVCIPDPGLSLQPQLSLPLEGRKGALVSYRKGMAQLIFYWVF